MFLRCITLVLIVCWLLLPSCVPDLPNPNEDGRFRCSTDNDCKSGYFCINGFCSTDIGDGGQDGQKDGSDGGDGSGDGDGCSDGCEYVGQSRCNGPVVQTCQINVGGCREWEDVTDCSESSQSCNDVIGAAACVKYCEYDSECQSLTDYSCDIIEGICVPMGLCDSDSDCDILETCFDESRVCIQLPEEECNTTSGPADLSCYKMDPVAPPATPSVCSIEGHVGNFFNYQNISESIGLTVRIHLIEDVLNGVLDNPITSCVIYDHQGLSHFLLEDVPTNTDLVMEVVGGQANGYQFATLNTFGINIRADTCADQAGVVSMTALALYKQNYDGYNNAYWEDIAPDPKKGLVFGRILDCERDEIVRGKGGISIPNDIIYYLNGGPPNPDATSTDSTGFFVVVNAAPIQGVATAIVMENASIVWLKTKRVRAFPGAGSIVIFDEPK